MPLVLSTHPLHPRAVEMIEQAATMKVASSLAPEELIKEAGDAEIIIVRAPLPPAIFEHTPRLRAAIRHGAGVDMIPVDAATEAGVLVANVPGVNAPSVAEYVMLCALTLARRFRVIDCDLRSKGWDEARDHAVSTQEISGKTLGLIGMGNVGREINRLAQAFNMRVIAFRPSDKAMPAGVTFKSPNEVITEADFLVLCCPLTNDTTGLMNRTRFALMKSSAFLINVARGPIIVEADLLQALETGTIAGAALDVFAKQPLAPDHPLLQQENALLTPHLAGITDESMVRMGVGVAEETLHILNGKLPENLVNPEAVSSYQARFKT